MREHTWVHGRVLMVIVATLLTLGFSTGHAHAVVTSSLWVPLNGSVFDEPTNEDVMIMGNLHTVIQVGMGAGGLMCAAHVNLPDTMGMGETSGMTYMANGAGKHPPQPCFPGTPVYFAVSLKLRPPNPNRNSVMPLIIWQQVMIDGNGQVMSIEAMFGSSMSCNPFMPRTCG